MNDFTKEELEEIKGWADYCVGSGMSYTETDPLYNKIQSMIDNYCEHKSEPSILTTICCNTEWHYFKHNKGIAQCPNCWEILK